MTKASGAGGTRKGMREAQTRAREWKKSGGVFSSEYSRDVVGQPRKTC